MMPKNGIFVNMKEEGIIDPTKVTITALENAISVSSMILTTSIVISDKYQIEEASKAKGLEDNLDGII